MWVAALLICVSLPATRASAEVALDPSFGGDGIVTAAIGPTPGDQDIGYALAIQPDGKLVVAGSSNEDFAVARFDSDGSLDTSFGSGGVVVVNMSDGASADEARGVVIQGDGKIVVAGFADAISASGGNGGHFAVARLTADGALDTSFDGDGKVETYPTPWPYDSTGWAIALQDDGRTVVAGMAEGSSTASDFALVRYNTDGSLDTSFDGDGIVTTPISARTIDPYDEDEARAVAIQGDGKIVAAGMATETSGYVVGDFALARYNADGSLDTGFDGDGKVMTPIGTGPIPDDVAEAIAIQDDGKLVAAGESESDLTLARYNADGSLDTGFSADGIAGSVLYGGHGLAVQDDGRLVATAPSMPCGYDCDFALARFDGDGSADTSFDGEGYLTTAVAPPDQNDIPRAVAVDDDGDIVAAGYADMGPTYYDYEFALTRYVEVPPGAPTITDADPDTPSNQNAIKVKGTAEEHSTVKLYRAPTASDCVPGNLVGTGSAAGFAAPGLDDTVPANATTTFRATATNDAGTSPCSAGFDFLEDSVAPTDPTLSSPSHTVGVPSNDRTVQVNLADAADSSSGVDGFSIEWDTSPATVPNETKDVEESATSSTSPALADSSDWYFHLRTRDNAGNWTSTVHIGPFVIDGTAPTDPSLSSGSHTVGVASNDNTVDVGFSGASDALSGVDGFSYQWSTFSGTTPDTVKDVEETAGGTTSPSLPDGSSHWFHLRTRDNAGNWTSTVHLGPFVIDTTPPAAPTLSATVPASPADQHQIKVRGSAAAGTTVRLYDALGTSDCTPGNLIGSGTREAFADPGLDVTVQEDHTTYLRATATDAAGNASACSTAALQYREDSTAPAAPTIFNFDPVSPANQNDLKVWGNAENGSTVSLYKAPTASDCTPGNFVVSGSSTTFFLPGLAATVPDNTVTLFRATATDAVGHVSDCSGGRDYVEDSSPPADPTVGSSSHTVGVPSNDRTVDATFTGASDNLSGVDGFSYGWSTSASSVPDMTKDAEEGATGVTSGDLTGGGWYFHLRTRDNAGNWTSTVHLGPFVIDYTPPTAPTLTDTDPDSPANQNEVKVKGSAEAGSTVRLYGAATTSDCTPTNLRDSDDAAVFADPGLDATVADNTVTRFRATATDAAGNTSTCSSSSILFTEDSAPPTDPTVASGSHAVGTPSRDRTVDVTFSGASDSSSGVDGFSYEWDTSAGTVPDATKDAEETATGTTSPALPDGSSHWFHLRTRDNAGNWTSTRHLGPFVIDNVAPDPPAITDTDPDSPANDNNPEVKGSAEGGSTVRLYAGADCGGAQLANGSAAAFAGPGLTPSLPGDTATTLRATATDAAGNVSACSTGFEFVEDSTSPANPALASPSHDTGVASNDSTVEVTFSGASDTLSGVDGFSYEWSTYSGTTPDTTKEAEQTATGTTSPALPDSSNHWFHLRTRDNAGNWTSTVHLGPFVIDTTPPTDPTLASASHAVGVASNDATVEVSFSGGSDERSGVDGFSYEWDTSAATVPDAAKDAEETATGTTSPALPDGSSHWFHLRTRDNAGNWTSTRHLGPFVIDTTGPTDPTLASASHAVGVASNDATVEVSFSGGSDERSGVDGFSYEWDTSAATVPDAVKDAEETATGATSPALPDSSNHWFHLRTRDNAGNWTSTRHLGPFAIDTTAPTDPTVGSTSHTVLVPSTDHTVDVTFTGATDALAGVDGFSYAWSTASGTVPDATKDVEETATGTTSPALPDGSSHWFHLRTRDNAGNWTSTRHLGPFVIVTPETPPVETTPDDDTESDATAPARKKCRKGFKRNKKGKCVRKKRKRSTDTPVLGAIALTDVLPL